MKNLRNRFIVIILCVVFFTLISCSDSMEKTEKSDITVVFIPKLTGNAFFEAANKGAQEYAERNGFKVIYSGNPVADTAFQIEIIQKAVTDNVDAICISSLDATALDTELKKAIQAGIKVVTWDSDVSGDARSLMISQGTPEQLGQMLVDMGIKSLVERGIDPASQPIKYAWHYSQASVADQNSWYMAGENYIKTNYPNWINAAPDNYYSNQSSELAVTTGEQILADHPDIDLIICNDSTALPGQAQALKNLGLTSADVTVTGFSSPNSIREYCKNGIISRWGLWDCQIQGALGCYMAKYLAEGNKIEIGNRIVVPEIGVVEIMPNTVLDPNAYTSDNSGVVLLPARTEFTAQNVDKFDF